MNRPETAGTAPESDCLESVKLPTICSGLLDSHFATRSANLLPCACLLGAAYRNPLAASRLQGGFSVKSIH